MGETFEDNMALCMTMREKTREGLEALQNFFQEDAAANGGTISAINFATVDMVNVERALTKFVAEKLGLIVDKEIFRGAVPPGLDGCSVCINHLDLSSDEAIPAVFAQFVCRDADRNRVMTLTSELAKQFPICGMSVTVPDGSNVTARLIQAVSAEIQVGQADSGKIKHFGFILLKVQL